MSVGRAAAAVSGVWHMVHLMASYAAVGMQASRGLLLAHARGAAAETLTEQQCAGIQHWFNWWGVLCRTCAGHTHPTL
jgi:hypothetical protein